MSRKEKERCEGLGRKYATKGGYLVYLNIDKPKKVPTYADQHLVTAHIHQQLGHPRVSSTIRAVQDTYYWLGMVKNIGKLVKRCTMCQAKRKNFLPMPHTTPTFKGINMWQFVSADLIEVRSEDRRWARFVLTCVDAYSKAPKLVPLKDKKAESIMYAFRDQVIMRYGCPLVVRTDGGREFMGKFAAMLKTYNITHIATSPYYPQGNGFIERLNRVIKDKL